MRLTITERSNLSDLFFERVAASPKAQAYRQFRDGVWVDTQWEQVARVVGRWQAGLRSAGLKSGDRVGICSRNRLEWVLFDQAALGLGLVTVPLFYNDRPGNMAWCLNDAGARVLLLDKIDALQKGRLSEVRQRIEKIKRQKSAAGARNTKYGILIS